MSANATVGIVIVALAIGGYLIYQQQQAAAAAAAYNRSLGGAIANTIGGVGSIIGAAVSLGGNGGGGSA